MVMNRERVVNEMAKMGLSVSYKGFNYIADALLIIDRNNGDTSVPKSEMIYEIADIHKEKWQTIERNIRYSVADYYENCEEMHPLLINTFKTPYLKPKEFLFRLYLILRDSEDRSNG